MKFTYHWMCCTDGLTGTREIELTSELDLLRLLNEWNRGGTLTSTHWVYWY